MCNITCCTQYSGLSGSTKCTHSLSSVALLHLWFPNEHTYDWYIIFFSLFNSNFCISLSLSTVATKLKGLCAKLGPCGKVDLRKRYFNRRLGLCCCERWNGREPGNQRGDSPSEERAQTLSQELFVCACLVFFCAKFRRSTRTIPNKFNIVFIVMALFKLPQYN